MSERLDSRMTKKLISDTVPISESDLKQCWSVMTIIKCLKIVTNSSKCDKKVYWPLVHVWGQISAAPPLLRNVAGNDPCC